MHKRTFFLVRFEVEGSKDWLLLFCLNFFFFFFCDWRGSFVVMIWWRHNDDLGGMVGVKELLWSCRRQTLELESPL